MKKINNKGFTLIELLAVIVILGVLLAVAVPATTKYIASSRRKLYVDNAREYITAARNEVLAGNYSLPSGKGDATLIHFSELVDKLERGGKESPYGTAFGENSYVLVVNVGTVEDPIHKYFVTAIDGDKYGIGVEDNEGKVGPTAIEDDYLKEGNIVKFDSSSTGLTATKDSELNLTYKDQPLKVTIKNIDE